MAVAVGRQEAVPAGEGDDSFDDDGKTCEGRWENVIIDESMDFRFIDFFSFEFS